MGEHLICIQKVAGSIPVTSINILLKRSGRQSMRTPFHLAIGVNDLKKAELFLRRSFWEQKKGALAISG